MLPNLGARGPIVGWYPLLAIELRYSERYHSTNSHSPLLHDIPSSTDVHVSSNMHKRACHMFRPLTPSPLSGAFPVLFPTRKKHPEHISCMQHVASYNPTRGHRSNFLSRLCMEMKRPLDLTLTLLFSCTPRQPMG